VSGYQCEKCSAPAAIGPQGVVRSCDCGVAVIANMQAVVYGEGHAAVEPAVPLIESLRKIGRAVLGRANGL
jgi:hypothetical protein